MPYVALQQLLDEGNQPGLHNYWSADFLADLPDPAVETVVSHAQASPSPFSQTILFHGGGAVARVGEEETAFGQRQAPYNVHYLGMWPPDHAQDEANIAHIRNLAAAVKPWTAGNAYLNFIGDEGLTRVETAFGPRKFERLRAIKEVWDPHNVFRHNQNIPPLRQRGEVPEAPVPQT
jgi:FAD/FMN-containing dehydrogenase